MDKPNSPAIEVLLREIEKIDAKLNQLNERRNVLIDTKSLLADLIVDIDTAESPPKPLTEAEQAAARAANQLKGV